MFEIGSSLREARMRQGIDLSAVERATRIRPKYLAALEEERFDVLPGPAYAKGFLRTYADYLGLDADRFVDEFNSRFAPEEEPPPSAPPFRARRRPIARDPRVLAVVGVALLGLLGWRLASGGHRAAAPTPPATHTTTTPPPSTTTITRAVNPTPPTARIMFVATRGPCWLGVHLDSATGTPVYETTLLQGKTARFVSRRLWIRIGAPWNVDATLNGKAVQLPSATGNVVVTPTGVTSAP
jgi:transcriptional regulator with XRE-family HTH domain